MIRFTEKLTELNKLPEYREKLANTKREDGVNGLLAVLKEYGIDIDFMELKQYGLRKQGII